MLKLNQKAPAFKLPDQDGKMHALKDYLGQWLVLYFYPKDDTPGCTTEACSFRDNLPKFNKSKAKVFGISVDPVKKHAKFAEKYQLSFTLLADENKEVVEKYGVWQEKSMYGRKYFGIARTTFIINPEGKIAKIYERVKPKNHAEEVLQDLKNLA